MGAAAFIMTEFTGIPYIEITKYAAIPALLYFLSIFLQVHFRSGRTGLTGLPASELPLAWRIIRKQGYLVIPVALIVWFMVEGYTPSRAGLMAVFFTLILCFLDGSKRRKLLGMLMEGLKDAPMALMTVTAACANAGIILGYYS
jgi:TRAP-type uncharacterized transport system fused permease subunit